MITSSLFILYLATMTGVFWGRARGGPPEIPSMIENFFFCLIFPFVLAAFHVNPWINGLTFIMAVAACTLGHGQYFLALLVKAIEPQSVDFLLRPFFGVDPRTDERFAYLRGKPHDELTYEEYNPIMTAQANYGIGRLKQRCIAGLTLTGLLVSLAPGIALMFTNPIAGLLIGASGAIKGPAYVTSDKIGKGTEGGEYGTGGAMWFICMGTLILFTVIMNAG